MSEDIQRYKLGGNANLLAVCCILVLYWVVSFHLCSSELKVLVHHMQYKK